MKNFCEEIFKNPTVDYRGLPFWSWNCKIKKEDISYQLDIFKEMGFGGVVVHPREGLDTEYLGEEFMEMIKHTADECGEKGLICWLYDDDRFPSGAADGLVTKNLNFRARQLRLTRVRKNNEYCVNETEFKKQIAESKKPKGYYLTAYSIEIEDKRLKSYKRLNSEDEILKATHNSENVYFAYLELYEETDWFQGQTYSDTMNPQAVDEFINITHERYKKTVGEQFGKSVKAIFTDEPRIGKQQPLNFANSKDDILIPYTEYFANEFKEKYGFDALNIIPEYIWDRADGNMQNRYIYHDMTAECFVTTFMDRICDWCKENGISMTGHILGESPLGSQATTVGDTMRCYCNMDIPGIDILIDEKEFTSVKQAASVAAQNGKTHVMSELYGVTHWDCTFKTYKLQGDWQAALGITIRIPHLSHMSLEGEAKRDWPASIFCQSPWYKEFPYIEDHFSRLNTILTEGKRITNIAMVNPIESMWVSVGTNDTTLDFRNELDKEFKENAEWLLYNMLDYDYLCEAMLGEQCKEFTENPTGVLKVGCSDYKTVIVPGMVTIRSTTLDILEKFRSNGGKVVFMGRVPKLVDGKVSDRATELSKKCICIERSKNALINELSDMRDIEIKKQNGENSNNLLYQLREVGKDKWLFVSHVNYKKNNISTPENYTVRVKGEYYLTVYDTMTGDKYKIPSEIKNNETEFRLQCFNEDSFLIKLTKEESEDKIKISPAGFKTVKTITDTESFERHESNVLLLDYARYSVDNGDIRDKDEILKLDNKIRKQLGFKIRTGQDKQPWATEKGEEHLVTLYYDIYSDIETSAQLGIEHPENCMVFLNDEAADNMAKNYFVDHAISVIDLPKIKAGYNELTIQIKYNQKTALENIYVLGDFDVNLYGSFTKISEQREKLRLGDITRQGMPFYTGNLEYNFIVETEDEDEYYIHIRNFKSPALAVSVDGEKKGLIAYAPHRLCLGTLSKGKHEIKVTLYGNRFNAFGTLHNANDEFTWYGNSSYRTSGDEWTDRYLVKDVGIISDIEIEKAI